MSARIFFRKFGNVIVTAFIAVLASSSFAYAVTKLFTIKTIEVRGSGISLTVDQKKLPKNLLFFPTEQIRNQLMNENPLLLDVEIQKKLPDTLVIIPKLRSPIARLKTTARTVDIDKDGIIISDSKPNEQTPLLLFDISPMRIGEKITDTQVTGGLSAIVSMGSLLAIDSITAQDSQSLQIKSGSLYIYITQQGDMADVSSTLQTLLVGFRIKGTMPALIDLRFAKPVISF